MRPGIIHVGPRSEHHGTHIRFSPAGLGSSRTFFPKMLPTRSVMKSPLPSFFACVLTCLIRGRGAAGRAAAGCAFLRTIELVPHTGPRELAASIACNSAVPSMLRRLCGRSDARRREWCWLLGAVGGWQAEAAAAAASLIPYGRGVFISVLSSVRTGWISRSPQGAQ